MRLVAATFGGILLLFSYGCETPVQEPYSHCYRVIDGDTFVTQQQTHVRLIGIDTPERREPYYNEAKQALSRYISGRQLRLERDVSDVDRFGRELRYVWTDVDSDGDEDLVNELMVSEGFARAKAYKPDVKHQDTLKSAETKAKSDKLGIWSGKK